MRWMIFSLNCLSRRLIICILASFFLWGCAHERGGDANTRTVVKPGGGKMRIALYPIDNLSGAFVQMKEIRASWLAKLKAMGFDVIDDEALERTMERHRIRYLGGIDSEA